MAFLRTLRGYVRTRRPRARRSTFESLEHRNMPAVLVDVGHHFVEPDLGGQTVSLHVASTDAGDAPVGGFNLRAQIVSSSKGPVFEGVLFAGNLWNTFPHVESGSPYPGDRSLATGDVAFTQDFEARADGTLVTLTIDTAGIPAGSYEFRLVGTELGSSSFRRADGSSVSAVITNGTLQVRSIWQNPDNPYDTNGDGRLTPLDVLLLLNELSKRGSRELDMPSPGEQPIPYYDVNGDGHLSPLDPLGIINCLNGLVCVSGPAPILAQVTPDFVPDSTSADDPNAGQLPPGTPKPDDCPDHKLDPDGKPYPDGDPASCEDPDEIDPNPIPIAPDDPVDPDPDPHPVYDVPPVEPDGGIQATGLASSATNLSSKEVDAVIADLVNDDLVELGLRSVFAIS